MKFLPLFFFLIFTSAVNAKVINTEAGDGSTVFSGDGGPAITAGIPNPGSGGASDRHGNYFFTDGNDNRIRKISTDGNITTVAGTVAAAHCNDVIGGGAFNTITGNNSGILLGNANNVCADYSYIAGGVSNIVSLNSANSFIGSGQNNLIDIGSTFSTILGGANNKICANHTFSAILGGPNNTVRHNCSAVFGNGITTQADNTFHVSCLNANNIPGVGSFPPGTVYKTSIPSLPAPYDTYLFLAIAP